MRLRHDGFRDCPEERSARLYRGSGPIGPPWDAAFSETAAAFLASHQSWHEQPQSLHLAIPQKGPLWGWCFEDKKSPRSIDRGRGDVKTAPVSLNSLPSHFECNVHDPRRFRVKLLIAEEWCDWHGPYPLAVSFHQKGTPKPLSAITRR